MGLYSLGHRPNLSRRGIGAKGLHLVERADGAILHFLNSVAGKSALFDHAVNLISRVHLLKGVVFFSVLWGAWFARSRDDGGTARRDVVLTLLAAAIAAPLSRVLQLVFPVRARPTLNSTLNFSPPVALTQVNCTAGTLSQAITPPFSLRLRWGCGSASAGSPGCFLRGRSW